MIKKLKKYILEGNIEEALKIIETFGNEKNDLALPILLELFETTDNNIVRNQIALALSDIGNTVAIEPLIKMILNPKTQKSRGTLLYSLKSFECSHHLSLFIKLLSDRSFEVSREAFSLIELSLKNVSNFDKEEYINLLQKEIELVNDRLVLLTEAKELFLDD